MFSRLVVVTAASIFATTLFRGAIAGNDRARALAFNNDEISMNSSLGQKLVKAARKLETEEEEKSAKNSGGEEVGRELEAYQGMDVSWLPNYSLKVQGCSHVTSWNDYAEDVNDVKLRTKRLLRFRLCPSDNCYDDSSYGCTNGSYGDYVVDLDLFLENYLEWIQEDLSNKCQEYAWKQCNCYDDGNKDDNFDQDQCEFQCWYKNGKSECYVDYTQDDDGDGFQLDNYMTCSAWYPPGYNGRRLDEEAEEEEEEEEEQDDLFEFRNDRVYYLGPHCSDSSNVYLGLFIDDTCSTSADNNGGVNAYKALTGNDLPYSGSNTLVAKTCLACGSSDEYGNEEIEMFCEGSYVSAAKCESHLGFSYSNDNGCNYIHGITYLNSKMKFNIFSYVYSWVDDYPDAFMVGLGSIFGASVIYALIMKWSFRKTVEEREKSKEIAFNAAQVESHYTDVKVKDAFLAM